MNFGDHFSLLLPSPFVLYAVGAMILVGLGIHGLLTRRHLLRKVMALNVIAGGIFLLLISTAYRNRVLFPDPVPHAMVLTGIVVAISATGFALVLVQRIHEGREDSDSVHSDSSGDG